LKQYKTCAEILRKELGVEPEAETKRLHDEIRIAESAPALPADHPDSLSFARSSEAVTGEFVKATISVAAFESIGDEPEQRFLASGFTEDVRSGLAKNRWLSVIAAHAVPQNFQDALQLREDAKSQGAHYLVEGTVRQFAKRLRVSVNLIDLRSGIYIWSQRYDRDVDDILSIQDDITASIVAMIEPELASAEGRRVRGKDAAEMNAWDCYHLGLERQYQFTQESNDEAQRLFRRAIELQPDFGAAYSRLSYAMVISAIYFEADHNSGLLDEALSLARQATRLDQRDAVSHFALGRTYLAMGDYERSVVELEIAIRLNPSLAQAHCGLGDSLAYSGKLDESISAFQEAVRLSPHDPYRWAFLMYGSIAHLFMRKHKEASEWASEAVRVPNSHYWANAALVSALGHLESSEDAVAAAVAELLRLRPDFTCRFARERLFYLRSEDQVNHYIEGLRKAGVPN
jgi:TolB-like protein/Tfp pilus assembly protein PilF